MSSVRHTSPFRVLVTLLTVLSTAVGVELGGESPRVWWRQPRAIQSLPR
ncbi:hypothetical protein SAMN04487968_12028 [Nocardioides terrae]|uniref:Uncharacterized protein n=1 Tax=Nocardioides terrae TaxID=574651 RepID=A0A1I1NZE1_9ACTN|nr:hypothetical protein SAMN04487968_12028 [Nocardioides terrae]